MSAFYDEARKQNLHFVVIKGIALSQELYGSCFARESSDIDILVAQEDIPKADYVARRCGWLQPQEAFRIRGLLNKGQLAQADLERSNAPFPFRSNRQLPHMTNYFHINNNDEVDSMEIHDRFSLLGPFEATEILWDFKTIQCCGTKIPCCKPASAFIVSTLSLYEDTETIRVNTSTRADFAIKTCFDVHMLLNMLDRSHNLQPAKQMVDKLGIQSAVSKALFNVCEVFPADLMFAQQICIPHKSIWQMPYLKRVYRHEDRAKNGLDILRAKVDHAPLDTTVNTGINVWSELRSLHGPNGICKTPVRFCANAASRNVLEITWGLDRALADRDDDIVFQLCILDTSLGDTLGWRVNFFLADCGWQVAITQLDIAKIDGHANKFTANKQTALNAQLVAGDLGCPLATFKISLMKFAPETCSLFPSAWERVCGNIFRRFAGIDLYETLELLLDKN